MTAPERLSKRDDYAAKALGICGRLWAPTVVAPIDVELRLPVLPVGRKGANIARIVANGAAIEGAGPQL